MPRKTVIKTTTIEVAICPHCGYEWQTRVEFPKKCPNPSCQRFYPLGDGKGLVDSSLLDSE